MEVSKTSVLILVEIAAAIRLEVRWRHCVRKAASVCKAVMFAQRFGRGNFGGSKAVGMLIVLSRSMYNLMLLYCYYPNAVMPAKKGERKRSQ